MKTLNVLRLLFALFVVISGCFGQVSIPTDRRTGSEPRLRGGPESGVVAISLHPRELITDLSTLVFASDLIIDATATVGSVTNFDSNSNISVETESTLVIGSAIKGSVPGEQNRVILIQPGGKLGELEVLSPDSPVVSLGGRYLLFRWKTRRNLPASKTGLERYEVVGSWAGLANVRQGKIWFDSERISDELRKYNGMGIDEFLELVSSHAQHRPTIKPEDLPEVPWPFTREEWEQRKRQMELERK